MFNLPIMKWKDTDVPPLLQAPFSTAMCQAIQWQIKVYNRNSHYLHSEHNLPVIY